MFNKKNLLLDLVIFFIKHLDDLQITNKKETAIAELLNGLNS